MNWCRSSRPWPAAEPGDTGLPRARIVLAGLLGSLLVLSSCTSGEGLPPLLLARDADVYRYEDGRLRKLGSVDGQTGLAVEGAKGDVCVQREFGQPLGVRSELVLIKENGDPPVTQIESSAPKTILYDAAVIDGRSQVFHATLNEKAETETRGELFVADGEERKITEAFGPEFAVERASYGGGVIVTSATCDLTECFNFYRPDGTELEDRPDPTDDVPYNAPPFMAQGVLSPGGSALAYLEGPDIDGAVDPEKRVGEWELVVQDQTDGEELVRLVVAPTDVEIVWLDFDGRWAVLSVETETGDPKPVLVVDTEADEPAPRELGDVVGIATIGG